MSGSRWWLFLRFARSNGLIAAGVVTGNALADGRVKPALLFWAIVIVLIRTLAQTLPKTEPRWAPKPRAE